MQHIDESGLAQKLNLETGQVAWSELAPHFARGVLLVVRKGEDLIQVSSELANNNTSQVEHYLDDGLLAKVDTELAKQWHKEDSVLWAVVIAPWVVVQPID